MDISITSFESLLPRLLNDIAECQFVAFDMEFSGIATKSPGKKGRIDERTMQARYTEVKEAAEMYQVLQMGMTFVKEDRKTGSYVLRPYNLHLNPVVDPGLQIERQWSYQSSAVDFLMRNGFRMEEPYTRGLRYLSRQEEASAKASHFAMERNRATIDEIQEDELSDGDKLFVYEVKRMIEEWVDDTDREYEFLNIPPPDIPDEMKDAMPEILNGFQKRLVHQTVRAKYPNLVSMGRGTFVQIVPFLEQREELQRQAKLKRSTERIAKNVGFRWVVEGLVGGDLSSLEPRELKESSDGDLGIINATETKDENAPKKEVKAQWEGLLAQLRAKKPVLVGHNIFTDLVNFYKCFIGELPERIEDFKAAIRELFPVVIDTKYLATYDQSLTPATSSLVEINTALRDVQSNIVLDTAHDKYLKDKPDHEAGYDSYITAQALIRLTTKLYDAEPKPVEAKPVESNDKSFSKADNSLDGFQSINNRALEPFQTRSHDNLSKIDSPVASSPSIVSRATQSSKPSDDLLGLEVQPTPPTPPVTRLLPPTELLIDPSKLLLGPPTPANTSDKPKSTKPDTPDWYHLPSLSSTSSGDNPPRLSLFSNIPLKKTTHQVTQSPSTYDALSPSSATPTSAASVSRKISSGNPDQTTHYGPGSNWSTHSREITGDSQRPGSMASQNDSTVTDNASSAPKSNIVKPSWRNKRSMKHAQSKRSEADAAKESQKPAPSWTQLLVPEPPNPRPETGTSQSDPYHSHSRPQSVYSSTSPDESKSTHSNITSPPSTAALSQANIKFMPPFEQAFWDKFRNKLRVYGTGDEMCDLSSGDQIPAKREDSNTWADQESQQQSQTRRPSYISNSNHPTNTPPLNVAGKIPPLVHTKWSHERQPSDGDSVCANVDNDLDTASPLSSPALTDQQLDLSERVDSPQMVDQFSKSANIAGPNLLDDSGSEREDAACEAAVIPTVSTSEEAFMRTRMRRLSEDSADMWLEKR